MKDRELNTVLAALRLWQMQRERDITGGLAVIASNGHTQEPLNSDEIDALCERLNTEADPNAEARAELARLEATFAEAGGRGVELAEQIDELRAELGETL